MVLGSSKPEEIPAEWIPSGATVLNCFRDISSGKSLHLGGAGDDNVGGNSHLASSGENVCLSLGSHCCEEAPRTWPLLQRSS